MAEDQNPDFVWNHYHKNRSFFFGQDGTSHVVLLPFLFGLVFLMVGLVAGNKREFWQGVLFFLFSRADGKNKHGMYTTTKKFPLSHRIMLLLAISLVIIPSLSSSTQTGTQTGTWMN